MANNRMWLICHKCKKTKKKDIQDYAFHLAKYYPSGLDESGWYVNRKNLEKDLDEFFKKHQHNFDKSHYGGCQYGLSYETGAKEIICLKIKKL